MQRSLIYCCLNVQPLKAALPAAQLGAGQLSTALPVRQRDGSTYPFRLPELRSITCCALGTQLIMGVIGLMHKLFHLWSHAPPLRQPSDSIVPRP